MKNIFVLLILLFNSFTCTCQNDSNIYFQCLVNHIENISETERKLFGKIITDTLFVQENDYVKEISSNIKGMQVKIINNEVIFSKTKKGKAILVLQINGLVFKEAKGFIRIVTFGVSRKKRYYKNINNGFSKYEIEFDCESGKYIFTLKYRH